MATKKATPVVPQEAPEVVAAREKLATMVEALDEVKAQKETFKAAGKPIPADLQVRARALRRTIRDLKRELDIPIEPYIKKAEPEPTPAPVTTKKSAAATKKAAAADFDDEEEEVAPAPKKARR